MQSGSIFGLMTLYIYVQNLDGGGGRGGGGSGGGGYIQLLVGCDLISRLLQQHANLKTRMTLLKITKITKLAISPFRDLGLQISLQFSTQ